MKKIFFGVLIGIVLMIPLQALASGFFVGKKYGTYSIKLEGIDSNKSAIIIKDDLYVSINDIGKLFGYYILINENDKEINLRSKKISK